MHRAPPGINTPRRGAVIFMSVLILGREMQPHNEPAGPRCSVHPAPATRSSSGLPPDLGTGGNRHVGASGIQRICQSGHVRDDLEAASEAYQAALRRVTDALAEVSEARSAVPDARTRLAASIVSAYRAGMRVGDIARVTSYGREQVRRILRARGVEPPGDQAS